MNLPDATNAVALAIHALVAAEDAYVTAVDAAFKSIQGKASRWDSLPGEREWQLPPEAIKRMVTAHDALSDARRKLAEAFTQLQTAVEARHESPTTPAPSPEVPIVS